MQPEMIADYACEVGEGPLWHPTEKRLYWADIPAGRLFRYDPATGQHEKFFDGGAVGGFTFQADGALLLFMAFGRVASLRDDTLTDVIPKIPGEEEFRFNDVMADPEGRVFCGTIHCTKEGTEKGRLYRLDNDGTATVVLDGVGISNGMGYTPDLKQMYFTDSIKGIDIFDYDRATGEISNRRPLVARQEGQGFLDGMTVDVDGNIWSARWGRRRRLRLHSRRRGDKEDRVPDRCRVERDLRWRRLCRHVRHHRGRPRQGKERAHRRGPVPHQYWRWWAARVSVQGRTLVLSPNPPKDTDGRREDSGRGWVRELQGRWPGVGVDGRPAAGLQSPHRAPKALCGSCDARDGERIRSRGLSRPGWREIAGTLGQFAGWPSGRERNGLQPGQGATELGFPRPAPGEMQSEAARRAGDPSHQSEDPPPEGLGDHGPLAQTNPRRPARRRWRRSAPTACGSARRRT